MTKLSYFVLGLFLLFLSPIYSQTIRYATSQDTLTIKNAKVGDLLITGGTEISNGLPAILIRPDASWIVDPGKKILIKGGVYDWIEIDNSSSGTSGSPIVITNYDGQVETKQLTLKGLKYFKLTGKYDSVAKTGDKNYPGHAAGYAWSQGKYGIFINRKWTNQNTQLLEIQSTIIGGTTYRSDNYEVEYIESGNGGYTNSFKWDSNTDYAILKNIKIHDCYFHDTGGEGIYMGYSENAPHYELFEGLQVYNNRFIRCGREGMQIKRFIKGTNIYNNVSVNTGMACWDSQDYSTVLWTIDGNTSVNNNLYYGNSGFASVQYYGSNDMDYVPLGGVASFTNNVILYMGVNGVIYNGAYGLHLEMNHSNNTGANNIAPASMAINNNYWGFVNTGRGENYTVVNDTYYPSISSPLVSTGNTYDNTGNTKTGFWQTGQSTSPTTNTGNSLGTVNDASFVNMNYGTGFDYHKFNFWSAPTSNSTNSYSVGWYVSYKSKIYKAINITPATNIEPEVTPGWQSYWQLQTYNGGTSFFPADDVRLVEGSFYKLLNCGLLDQAPNTPLPVTLTNFSAKAGINNTVNLSWSTASEILNKGFNTQRQVSGTNGKFETIRFIPSKAQNGNSNIPLYYSFVDISPIKNATNYYRLAQVDLDGKTTYSDVKWVRIGGETATMVYPNPSSGVVNISRSANASKMNVQILDMSGRMVQQYNNITKSNLTIKINFYGVYNIKLLYPETMEQTIQKIIIQK
jgi:hypothetical protein